MKSDRFNQLWQVYKTNENYELVWTAKLQSSDKEQIQWNQFKCNMFIITQFSMLIVSTKPRQNANLQPTSELTVIIEFRISLDKKLICQLINVCEQKWCSSFENFMPHTFFGRVQTSFQVLENIFNLFVVNRIISPRLMCLSQSKWQNKKYTLL